ncbi:MAG: hypothetical protein L6408_02520 [Nanoarchaeota archaeon]|nr:hypothetical protein [Nanoarchaeota archaeon]
MVFFSLYRERIKEKLLEQKEEGIEKKEKRDYSLIKKLQRQIKKRK